MYLKILETYRGKLEDRKKRVKIRTETNKMETKSNEKNQLNKNYLIEKINKIGKPLAAVTRKNKNYPN